MFASRPTSYARSWLMYVEFMAQWLIAKATRLIVMLQDALIDQAVVQDLGRCILDRSDWIMPLTYFRASSSRLRKTMPRESGRFKMTPITWRKEPLDERRKTNKHVWYIYFLWKIVHKAGSISLSTRKGTDGYTAKLKEGYPKMVHVPCIRLFKWPRNPQS